MQNENQQQQQQSGRRSYDQLLQQSLNITLPDSIGSKFESFLYNMIESKLLIFFDVLKNIKKKQNDSCNSTCATMWT